MSIKSIIKEYPRFAQFAREQWEQHPDFWQAEARSAPPGIFRTLAVVVCAIAEEES